MMAGGNLLKLGANTTTQSAYIGCTQESGFDYTNSISAKNQLTVFSYDAAGNVLNPPGPGGTVTYDAENRLLSAGGVTYQYDGDGKRVYKSTGATYWYGAGSEPLLDNIGYTYFFNGMRVAREYWSPQHWYDHYALDHLGNTRYVYSNSGGSDVSDFYPFGRERVYQSHSSNQYKFTGKERDSESGLDYFGARYFGSTMGRFMSPDPLLNSGQPWNPQSWNRYAYTENNPLRYTDPTGLYKFGDCSGTAEQCLAQEQRFRDSIAKAQEALKGLDPNSKEAKALQKTLDKLGDEDEGNIKINFGDAGKTNGLANLGRTLGNNITINYDAVDREAKNWNLNASESAAHDAGVTAHEGAHVGGGKGPFALLGMHGEHAAYFAESVTYQGLHNTDKVYKLWNESWLTVDQDRLSIETRRENAIQSAIHPPRQQQKQENPQ